jgi:hypothetical protein
LNQDPCERYPSTLALRWRESLIDAAGRNQAMAGEAVSRKQRNTLVRHLCRYAGHSRSKNGVGQNIQRDAAAIIRNRTVS